MSGSRATRCDGVTAAQRYAVACACVRAAGCEWISAIRDPRVHACLVEGGIARFKRERGKVAERDPGDEDEVSP